MNLATCTGFTDRGSGFRGLPPSEEGTIKTFLRLLHESQGQNLALIVLYVPYSLDRGGVNNCFTKISSGSEVGSYLRL